MSADVTQLRRVVVARLSGPDWEALQAQAEEWGTTMETLAGQVIRDWLRDLRGVKVAEQEHTQ